MTVEQLYDEAIKPLPAAERLRLAAMILNHIPPDSVVDSSDEWTEEDYQDFSRASWERTDQAIGETENA